MRPSSYYVALALCLSVQMGPVLAQEDETGMFVAVSEIEGPSYGTKLAALSDDSLGAVEGAGMCIGCPSLHIQIGISPIVQVNLINQLSFALGNNITQLLGASAVNVAGGSVRRP
jgi:hypothetical protein